MHDRETKDRKAEHTMIILTILLVVGMGTFAIWWQQNHTPFTVTIPTPVLPKPNARDTYQLAYTQMRDRYKLPDRNARTNKKYPTFIDYNEILYPSGRYTLAQRQVLLKINTKGLATLHTGFAQQYHDLPIRSFDYYSLTSGDSWGDFRYIGRILQVEGRLNTEAGNTRQAVRSFVDMLYFGNSLYRGASMVGMSVGISVQNMARPELWPLIKTLPAADALGTAQRLEEVLTHRTSYAAIVQEEKWAKLASLQELFSKPHWRENIISEIRNPHLNSFTVSVTSKGQILRHYARYMDAATNVARKPYGAHLPPPAAPGDIVSRSLTESVLPMRVRFTNAETQLVLLATACALQAYQQEHGAYPSTLAALVPKYLSSLHSDPFANGQPIHYKRTRKAYVLYSIGPDGKDDGGKAIINLCPNEPVWYQLEQRHLTLPDSKGDIVAGTNIN